MVKGDGTAMNSSRRHGIIVDMVRQNGRVRVDELARTLDTSRETIRRDLNHLSQRGLLTKVHGGAVRPGLNIEGDFEKRLNENVAAKRAVARAAAALFEPGDSLFIDTGSTTLFFAEQIARLGGMSVATNSVAVAASLSGGKTPSDVFLVGGAFNYDNRQTVGETACAHIESFRAHTAVLTVGAIHPEAGVMDYNNEEAQVARAMIRQARRVVVLADTSKFGCTAMFAVCDLNRVDILVCETPPQPEFAGALNAAGVRLVTPEGVQEADG